MATQTLAVNADHDIYIGSDGDLAVAVDFTAVTQTCEQVSEVRLGEVPINTLVGMPFFEAVWVGVPNIPRYRAALSVAILAVPGVIELLSLEVTQDGELLSYVATIVTEYGTGVISG